MVFTHSFHDLSFTQHSYSVVDGDHNYSSLSQKMAQVTGSCAHTVKPSMDEHQHRELPIMLNSTNK